MHFPDRAEGTAVTGLDSVAGAARARRPAAADRADPARGAGDHRPLPGGRARRCCRCCTWCRPTRATSSPEGVALCAEELGLTKAEVGAVATFYTMYKRRPTGRHLVSVCTNTLCSVLGGQRIMDALSAPTSASTTTRPTADGSITLEHAECLAACDYAPVVTVDYEFYDQQDVESARELVAALRRGEKPLPTRGAPLTDFRGISRQLAGFSQHADDAAAARRRRQRRRARPDADRAAAGRGARRVARRRCRPSTRPPQSSAEAPAAAEAGGRRVREARRTRAGRPLARRQERRHRHPCGPGAGHRPARARQPSGAQRRIHAGRKA